MSHQLAEAGIGQQGITTTKPPSVGYVTRTASALKDNTDKLLDSWQNWQTCQVALLCFKGNGKFSLYSTHTQNGRFWFSCSRSVGFLWYAICGEMVWIINSIEDSLHETITTHQLLCYNSHLIWCILGANQGVWTTIFQEVWETME